MGAKYRSIEERIAHWRGAGEYDLLVAVIHHAVADLFPSPDVLQVGYQTWKRHAGKPPRSYGVLTLEGFRSAFRFFFGPPEVSNFELYAGCLELDSDQIRESLAQRLDQQFSAPRLRRWYVGGDLGPFFDSDDFT